MVHVHVRNLIPTSIFQYTLRHVRKDEGGIKHARTYENAGNTSLCITGTGSLAPSEHTHTNAYVHVHIGYIFTF